MRPAWLAAALAAAPLAAQGPELRADLDRQWAELAGIRDTAALHRLERTQRPPDGDTDTAAHGALRRGFTRLRLAEAGDGWFFERAARDFSAAGALRPEWPLPWYGLALAERGRAAWLAADPVNLGSRVGYGPLAASLRAARQALAAEPGFLPALSLLSEAATALRDTQALGAEVRPALTQAWAAGVRAPELLLAMARLGRQPAGDSALPDAALDELLPILPATAEAGHELAWSGLARGRPWADSLYFSAAIHDDLAGVAAYRRALRAVAADSALAGFDATEGAARAAWLRTFWEQRARRDLRAPAERLAEHYKRLAHAVNHFALQVNRRYYAPNNIYRSEQAEYDDRGVVWIRFGAPDDRLVIPLSNLPPLETWRYRRADGDLLLHFQAGGYSQAAGSGSLDFGGAIDDYRLIPTLLDWMYSRSAAYDMLLASRCELHELYCRFLGWGPNGRRRVAAEEAALVHASTVIATGSDAFERRFPTSLAGSTEAFAVGQAGGGALLHLAFQLPVEVAEATAPGALLRTPVHVRLAVLDDEGVTVGWIDTTTIAALPPGRPGVLEAFGRVAVAVPPGRLRYRVELSVGDAIGRVFPTDSVRVGSFDGRTLALSDVVLGKPGIGALWSPTAGDTAYFTPRGTWARGDTLALYHEVYGLAAGAAYTARITVRQGRRVALTTGWDGVAAGSVTRITRSLSMAGLRPGRYELELEVRGPDGARATARRGVRITE